MKYLGAPQSGSQANTTASKNRAGQYYRNRRSPVQPIGTGRRATVRANFGSASSSYASLTGAQQAAWAAYAATTPYVDSLGQAIVLTGHQIFVAINSQLLNCGSAINPTPPISGAVAPIGLVTVSAMADGTVIVTLAGTGSGFDFATVSFSSPQSGGTSFCKVFWQASVQAGDSTDSTDYSGQYVAQFGIAPQAGRVFYNVRPINQYGVGGVPAIAYTSVLPAVAGSVVTAGLATVIHWTAGVPVPHHWLVQYSTNGGLSWKFYSSVTGATLTETGLPSGALARVVGMNADNTISNGASNSVTVD